jgi:hypothetical protein
MHTKIWLENMKGRDYLENLQIDMSIILEWIALSLGVKQPAHEADHSPPSSAKVKEWVELYLYSPSLKKKHRDNFMFTFTLYLTEMRREGVDWLPLAQDMDQ